PTSISGNKMRSDPARKIQDYLKKTEQRAGDYPPENFYKNQIIHLIINQKQIERAFAVIDRLDYFSDVCDKFYPIGDITLGEKPYYDHNWHSFRRLGKNLDRRRYNFLSTTETIEQELKKNETIPVNIKDGLIEKAVQLVERRASVKKELRELDEASNDDISLKAAQRSYQLFLDAELDILAERYGIGDLDDIYISFGKSLAGLPANLIRSEHINMALELRQKIADNEKLQTHRQQLEADKKKIEAKLTAIWLLIKDEQDNLPDNQSN
ncbi:hypothetical protein KKC47_00380, partial [Patescibacteria group bacterium]|nr:hypothetical protein [Patescibacteria group bacterium]